MSIDLLVVGHLVKDVTPDGKSFRIGGTAAYASALGRALGLRVGVLTAASRDLFEHSALDGIDVRGRVVDEPTRFDNRYDGSARVQRLLGRAPSIGVDDLPEPWRATSMVLLGPVIGEVDPALAGAFNDDARVAACLQGWLREVDSDQRVHARSQRDLDADTLLPALEAAFVSPEDLRESERDAALAAWRQLVDPLLYTLAERGADVLSGPRRTHVPAFCANTVDPTGAGDIFAASYLIARGDGLDAVAAARFASCAASFIVEAPALQRVPDRASIEARLRDGDVLV